MNFEVIFGILVIVFLSIFMILRYRALLGSKKRDEAIVQKVSPIANKLESGKSVSKEEVSKLASKDPEARVHLWLVLEHHKRMDLFPEEYLKKEAIGESILAYRLLHPNEYGRVPEKINFVTTVNKKLDGKEVEYLVYKFFNEDSGQWEAGVAGPFFPEKASYLSRSAFSSFDSFDSKTPEEHVEEFHSWVEKDIKRNIDKM